MRKPTQRATKAKPLTTESGPAGLSEADVDAYVAENRDGLEASIKRARADFAKGIHSPRSVGDIIAEGKRR